jgi:hypothetical protein
MLEVDAKSSDTVEGDRPSARLGDVTLRAPRPSARTEVALSRAEQMLGSLDSDSIVPSAFGYDEAQFRFHESNSYTHLHETEAA